MTALRGKPDATDNGDGADRFIYGNAPSWHYVFRNNKLVMIIQAAARDVGSAPAPAPDPPLHQGTSVADAIVIKGENETTGVAWEYAYLALHPCPDGSRAKMLNQSLEKNGKNAYDVLTVQCGAGAKRSVFFDISDFFGKL